VRSLKSLTGVVLLVFTMQLHMSLSLLFVVGFIMVNSGDSGQSSAVMPKIFFGIANHTRWIEVGGRGLDSGYVYGDDNQRELGQAINNSGVPRSELFVITKMPCCPSSFPDQICTHPEQQGAQATMPDFNHSMSLLGLDYVDLLLLH